MTTHTRFVKHGTAIQMQAHTDGQGQIYMSPLKWGHKNHFLLEYLFYNDEYFADIYSKYFVLLSSVGQTYVPKENFS